ncbi:putative nrps-like enzyme protein [Neofusicoccum parvum UCRNP2]|uniref:Putative nrps-like enzyme protein n=1 Tax=Botryosphaeria parva (strain UCR-NP2) TaxID=1287680 RepID=R1ERM9_BOTPV|nr:putative nrps-like enzyme protein [Neofusicoccum parvum UCRNP2]
MVSQISHELTQSSASPLNAVPLITRADYRASATSVPIGRVTAHTGALQGSKTAWIIHSSGSTGFPKPIFLSHRALLANFAKGLGLRAFCASPLFHSHGLMELFRCIYRGAPMYMANHARPVTRANLVRAMRAAAPELVTAVPFVLGLLAEGPDGVAELARAEVVMFAGSACPDAVGDRLVEAGVNLVANYGSSETGAIMSSLRPRGDTDWAYVRMAAPVAPHVLMDEIAPGVFECVALESLASRGPSNCDDPPNSFRTRDLFTRHPDPARRHWWKYLTRLDDRLTLVNGEKVLPLPIEGRVRQSELVAEAVVFGAGRAVPGLLVFRALGERAMGDGEFVEAVWEAVEDANRGAESFSRIPRELVVPMPLGTEWPRTDKGTVVRQQVYDVFKDVIDGAYARFEQIDQDAGSDEPLLSLDVPELEQWLLERFRVELGAQLQSAEADIFAAGVDSLQTMRMWSLIRKTLDLGTRREELSQNVVYEKGNVKVLAKHLYGLRTGEEVEQSDEDELLAMQELVEKYSIFDEHVPEIASKPEGEVVVSICLQVGTFSC